MESRAHLILAAYYEARLAEAKAKIEKEFEQLRGRVIALPLERQKELLELLYTGGKTQESAIEMLKDAESLGHWSKVRGGK